MALEDHCRTPHSIGRYSTTSSPEIEIMRNSPTHMKMSLHVPKTEIIIDPAEYSPSPAPSRDSRYDMEEEEDMDPRCRHPADETTTAINFSITNILSDNFGKHTISRLQHQQHPQQVPDRNNLFRPYDIKDEIKTKYFNTILDFTQDNLYKLSAKNYPKIHEEIYNQQHRLSEAALSKIPPLGGLCKAISQIGQISPSNLAAASRNTFSPAKSDSSFFSTGSQQSPSPVGVREQTSSDHHQPRDSGLDSSDDTRSESGSSSKDDGQGLWPAWVFCTRYSDRPSSGPRYRRPKQPKDKSSVDDKRPRTAFSSEQLGKLKQEFNENRYLTERRRQKLSADLGLNEAQIKIWFQNKRAKIKKSSGHKNPLALQLMAQGLYNHTTVPLTKEEEELEMRMNGQLL